MIWYTCCLAYLNISLLSPLLLAFQRSLSPEPPVRVSVLLVYPTPCPQSLRRTNSKSSLVRSLCKSAQISILKEGTQSLACFLSVLIVGTKHNVMHKRNVEPIHSGLKKQNQTIYTWWRDILLLWKQKKVK